MSSRAGPELRSVRFLGQAPSARGEGWVLIGQDGGQSIHTAHGTLFVFADTLLTDPARAQEAVVTAGGERRTGRRMGGTFLGNCAALGEGESLAEAMASLRYYSDSGHESGHDSLERPREILERTPEEAFLRLRFWPQHGVEVDGEVLLFYNGIQQLDAGTWGFKAVGSGLATFDAATGTSRRLRAGDGEWRLWGPDLAPWHLGVQVLREDDELYVFASCREGWGVSARLARVGVDDRHDPRAYRYLTSPGPSWSADPTASLDLGACAAEFSVSHNPYLGAYLMTYVDGFAKELCLRSAPRPWGPWSEELRVGGLPYREEPNFVALGFEHPVFAHEGGRTVAISYCQPHFTQNSLVSLRFR